MKAKYLLSLALLSATLSGIANATTEFDLIKTDFFHTRRDLVNVVRYNIKDPQIIINGTNHIHEMMMKSKAPIGREGSHAYLIKTWLDFKETREKELLPAITNGQWEIARTVGLGIQKIRFDRCTGILYELDKYIEEPEKHSNSAEYIELGLRLSEARMSMLKLMKLTDIKTDKDANQLRLVEETADAVSYKLIDIKPEKGTEEQFKEMVKIWEEFKDTRNKVIIPLLLQNKVEEANTIFLGVQKERFSKITNLKIALKNHTGQAVIVKPLIGDATQNPLAAR